MAIENCRKRRRIDDDSEEVNRPSPISNLGDDVLAEVLIRAPEPGSAWRCKAVCKRWNSLISDPQFVHRFISHHHQSSGEFEEPPFLSPRSRESILSFLPVPFVKVCLERYYFQIFDSSKDLVLCGFHGGGVGIHAEFARSLFLCNPFTRQWIALPLAPRLPSTMLLKEVRLVCEPRDCIELDRGGGRPPFIYSSAYRFRVVCIYDLPKTTRIDVFCSESGEWTEEALVFDGETKYLDINVVSTSCNGGMVWFCFGFHLHPRTIAGFNPFRLDMTLIRFDVSRLPREGDNWNISVSQGALHLISLGPVADQPAFLSVWRLEEDRKVWSIQHKTLFRCDDDRYELKDLNVVALHPEKPHIVFLMHRGTSDDHSVGTAILSYDMKTGELRFFADFEHRWMVFQPRFSCWPTPIPRYDELRGIYDGRHSCWVQRSSKAATLSLYNCGRVVKERIMQLMDCCNGWFN